MSFFDQPYYALTKALMSRVGIWPEQSKYVRIILPFTMFAITLTAAGPVAIRLLDDWRDIDILARNTTILLIGTIIFFIVFSCITYADNMRLSLKNMEKHWEMLKNTPAVTVLDRYAEGGRYITAVYSTSVYVAMIFYFGLCLSPIILDFVDPVNETRPKIYVVETEYGVDQDKYYWFIITHTYIVVAMVISIMIALGTMYILWAVHACALFEVVGFNLELIAHEHTVNRKNAITRHSDWYYKKICDCIILHIEAISFADLVESGCYRSCGVLLAIMATVTVISGVQALINFKHPAILMQQATLVIGQVFHLYIASIPGQKLIDHSGKIHTTAYNLGWQDMPVNTQKLLIQILMRSNKPCCFTGGKVYVLSMETFGSAIRTMLSYFTIFAQMI